MAKKRNDNITIERQGFGIYKISWTAGFLEQYYYLAKSEADLIKKLKTILHEEVKDG